MALGLCLLAPGVTGGWQAVILARAADGKPRRALRAARWTCGEPGSGRLTLVGDP